MIQILLGNQHVGSVKACLYRKDLEQAGIGSGDHAFIFNFDQRLSEADIQNVSVLAVRPDGSFETISPVVQTNIGPTATITPLATGQLLQHHGMTSDAEQHPVFVLGAARSGTSAIAQALLKLGRFHGHEEGHLLDLMAHFSVMLDKFYHEKYDEWSSERNTMVSFVPQTFFNGTIDEIFIRIIRELFPGTSWVDKTPNSNMVYLAPRFRRIWPNSRFIFMKRRALENLASRAVKFPGIHFVQHCGEWNSVMAAWLAVRSELEGAAIEIDQKFLKEKPDATAAAVGRLLNLNDVETERLYQAFQYDLPERTSVDQGSNKDITKMGWADQERSEFAQICAGTMALYGYGTDDLYYVSGCEQNGLIWI